MKDKSLCTGNARLNTYAMKDKKLLPHQRYCLSLNKTFKELTKEEKREYFRLSRQSLTVDERKKRASELYYKARAKMTPEQHEARKEYSRNWHRQNELILTDEQKEKRRQYFREYRKRLTAEQKEKIRESSRAYYKNNPEARARMNSYTKAYYRKNKDKVAEWRKEYYRTNSEARSNHKIRCWLWQALKREGTKKISWIENVGCTKEEFKAHIESQFQEGMTWDNWTVDGWHIDHIIPLSKGGTNHYTNLQPLWAIDNLSKKDKLFL